MTAFENSCQYWFSDTNPDKTDDTVKFFARPDFVGFDSETGEPSNIDNDLLIEAVGVSRWNGSGVRT